MPDEITKIEEKSPVLTSKWNYDSFVALGKANFKLLGRAQIELIRVLYRANMELSQAGFRSDKKLYKNDITSSQMGQGSEPIHTFREFCEEIGISKTTAYRWLEAYDSEHDRLYTPMELRQLKESAKESAEDKRFFEVHEHRANGEPNWKPADWDKMDEIVYEQWLERKGYKKSPDIKLAPQLPPMVNKYGQFGLFSADYLDSLNSGCIRETQGDGAIKFSNLCDKYEKSVPKGIQPRDVMRIPVMVKVALENLPAEARKESARLVAEIILAEEA